MCKIACVLCGWEMKGKEPNWPFAYRYAIPLWDENKFLKTLLKEVCGEDDGYV